ncbi:MAG TPA: GspH/FimT family pseudopilin [Xanthomonadaceae bacterium]|nr:GspH/FimT family pseudopilin [Xanthomonadaceae bacterium]
MESPAAVCRGFTLIEASISLCVTALLVGLAVPAWSNAVSAAHAAQAQAELFQTLTTALTHATATGAEVVVCPSRDGRGCTGGSDWSGGWVAFADLDGDRQRDARDTLLRQHGPLTGGVHLRTSAGRPRIVFQPHGGAAAGYNATFTLCDRRGPGKATALVLANSGRLRQDRPGEDAVRACLWGG